jgi:tripartite-type tricarboxylate transporter receptor subunit TctC
MAEIDRRTFSLLGLATMLLSPWRALAEDAYPSRPIRVIVGFPAGSAADVIARVFGTGAGRDLGQQIIVENVPGASSKVAAEYVAHAAGDGYTLFLASISIVTKQATNPDQAFDLLKDFAPIAPLASSTLVLVVNPASNVGSVAELIGRAKSNPGRVLCAHVGVGSLPHLAGELFAQRAGIKLLQVSYSGSPQVITDLLAGRVTMFFSPISTALGHIESGKLNAIAMAADQRANLLPNVPSMPEAGMPNFDASAWWGLMAPVGTPQTAVERIAAATHKAMLLPEAVRTLQQQGFAPLLQETPAFAQFVRAELNRWSEVARTAGLSKS